MRRAMSGAWLAAAAVVLLGCSASEQANTGAGDAGGGVTPDMGATAEEMGDGGGVQGPVVYQPRFDLDGWGEDFYAMPWPSSYRTHDDGTLDLTGLPRSGGGLLKLYRKELEQIEGYSTMPVVYIHFEEGSAPQPAVFPLPADSLAPTSAVQILDVSEEGCGERVPALVTVDRHEDSYSPGGLVRIAPVPGFVLQPDRDYAMILLRSLGDKVGDSTARPEGFDAALSEDGGGDAKLAEAYAPLRRCLASDPLAPEDIAVATVFHTQDPLAAARALHQVVSDEVRTAAPTIDTWEVMPDDFDGDPAEKFWTSYRGTYETPIYQKGTPPYSGGGSGGLVLDEQGLPVEQARQTVPFLVTVPDEPGPEPLKVLVWMGGTGATLTSHIGRDLTSWALQSGFAVLSFVPQFHEGRRAGSSDEVASTFNYINPTSGRTVFLQQMADTAYFVRLIRDQIAGHADLPALDLEKMVYGGQSQGGIVGAIAAGVLPDFDAYVLNGVGGYLSATIVFRIDPIDIELTLRQFLNIDRDIDRFHPVVQLAQLGVDRTDTMNYARSWKGHELRPQGVDVLLINGFRDHTTHFVGIDSLTIAGDTEIVEGSEWDVDPHLVWQVPPRELPIQGNRTSIDGSPITLASYLNITQGHFTVFRDDLAASLALNFWGSAHPGPAAVKR